MAKCIPGPPCQTSILCIYALMGGKSGLRDPKCGNCVSKRIIILSLFIPLKRSKFLGPAVLASALAGHWGGLGRCRARKRLCLRDVVSTMLLSPSPLSAPSFMYLYLRTQKTSHNSSSRCSPSPRKPLPVGVSLVQPVCLLNSYGSACRLCPHKNIFLQYSFIYSSI